MNVHVMEYTDLGSKFVGYIFKLMKSHNQISSFGKWKIFPVASVLKYICPEPIARQNLETIAWTKYALSLTVKCKQNDQD